MRKIYSATFVCFLFVFMAFGPKADTTVKWYDWNEGYELAGKKGKLLLVDVYTDWCGWCKKMDRDTYSNEDVVNNINKNFIPVKLNPERTDVTYKIDTLSLKGNQLLYILTNGQRTGFPTTIFVDPTNNSIVYAEAGYQDADQFKKILTKVANNRNK